MAVQVTWVRAADDFLLTALDLAATFLSIIILLVNLTLAACGRVVCILILIPGVRHLSNSSYFGVSAAH